MSIKISTTFFYIFGIITTIISFQFIEIMNSSIGTFFKNSLSKRIVDKRPIILWGHPRSLSSAFERAFRQRSREFYVLHEPFCQEFTERKQQLK
ncbi:hypothetical protein C2G38_2223090, partial [Gigaspora rosea]